MSSPDALPRTNEIINAGIAQGSQTGAQVYVSLAGRPVADFAVGLARPGVPMTTGSMMRWFSSTKPVASVAIGQLWERGKLDVEDRVCRYIPEFGTNGKDRITIRQILTHTGGFHTADDDSVPSTGKFPGTDRRPTWDEIIARVCAAEIRVGWIPGRTAGYQGLTGYFILGELVRRLDGRPYERYVREAIFEPLGMDDCWIGMPVERFAAYGERIGQQQNTSGPRPVPVGFSDSEEGCTACQPGGGGRGPIRELARMYEMLLLRGERSGVRLLSSIAVEALTARHRAGTRDTTFGVEVDWGLGFAIQMADTGRHSSPRVFGHGGNRSVMAFADPEYGLVVTATFNGMPAPERHWDRVDDVATAIYEDVGIAVPGSPGVTKPHPQARGRAAG